jgi:hypothetical protein
MSTHHHHTNQSFDLMDFPSDSESDSDSDEEEEESGTVVGSALRSPTSTDLLSPMFPVSKIEPDSVSSKPTRVTDWRDGNDASDQGLCSARYRLERL